MTSECPSEDELIAWAGGRAPTGQIERLSAHIDTCASCRFAFSALVADARAIDATARQMSQSMREPLPVSPGDLLDGKYTVMERVGRGGMGVVVKAWHEKLKVFVAIKFARAEFSNDPDLKSRFLREARTSAALASPYINRVFDVGELPNGTPFIVFEFLSGQTLEDRLEKGGPLPEREAVAYMAQLLQGLQLAHSRGVIHRDLKPANVFLRSTPDSPEPVATLLDFGIAKTTNPTIDEGLSRTGPRVMVGSPSYMSPEQLDTTANIDVRTDIWGMGCLLYSMLNARPPFEAANFLDMAFRIRKDPPAPMSRQVSAQVEQVISRCLAKSPDRRFPSARAMLEALQVAPPPEPQKKHMPWVGLGAAAVVLLGVFVWFASSPTTPPVSTAQEQQNTPVQVPGTTSALEPSQDEQLIVPMPDKMKPPLEVTPAVLMPSPDLQTPGLQTPVRRIPGKRASATRPSKPDAGGPVVDDVFGIRR